MTAINPFSGDFFTRIVHPKDKKHPADAKAPRTPGKADLPETATARAEGNEAEVAATADRTVGGRTRQLATRVFARHHPLPHESARRDRNDARAGDGEGEGRTDALDRRGARVRRDTAQAESAEATAEHPDTTSEARAIQPPKAAPASPAGTAPEPAVIAEARAAHDGRAAAPADWAAAAKLANCEPAVLRALYNAQAAARPAFKEGYPVIQFHREIFAALTQHRYDRSHHDVSGDSYVVNGRIGQDGEFLDMAEWQGSPRKQYVRLARAAALDESAALQACNWGPYRLSGTLYAACGYDNVQEFVRDMFKSDAAQLSIFARYCASRVGAAALADRNWVEISRAMNPVKASERTIGSYAKRLEKLYAKPADRSTRPA